MKELKQILVATDLSPRADLALARAVLLAAQHGAALSVLHVVESLRPGMAAEDWLWPSGKRPKQLEAELARDAQGQLERRLRALPEGPKIRTQVVTSTGIPFVEIIQRARTEDADLIVLGAHGRAFLRDLLLGTTAERVVRKGDRPVLVVKNPCEEAYRRVLAPVDFSATSKKAVDFAIRLAPAARMELLHAYEFWYEGKLRDGGMSSDEIVRLHQNYEQHARAELQTLASDCAPNPDSVRFVVRHGYPATAITRAVIDQRADLVAIGTHGLSGLRYVLLGSVAEHVLREAPADVLVVRPAATEFALP